MKQNTWDQLRTGVWADVRQHWRTPPGLIGMIVLLGLVFAGLDALLNYSNTMQILGGWLGHPWVLWSSLTAVCVAAFFYSGNEARQHADAMARLAREQAEALLRPIRANLEGITTLLHEYDLLAATTQARADCEKAFKYCRDIVGAFESANAMHLSEFRRRVGEIIITVNGFSGQLREITNGEYHMPVVWEQVGDVSSVRVPEERLPDSELKLWRQVEYFYQANAQSFGAFELTLKQRIAHQRRKLGEFALQRSDLSAL